MIFQKLLCVIKEKINNNVHLKVNFFTFCDTLYLFLWGFTSLFGKSMIFCIIEMGLTYNLYMIKFSFGLKGGIEVGLLKFFRTNNYLFYFGNHHWI